MSTITQEQVVEALREVFDPEIPVNVYDLGLIYGLDIDEQNNIGVTMTLPAPGCSMGPQIAQNAEWRIAEIDGAGDVQVEMVFDPPWTPNLITEEGKKLLGID